MTASVKQIWSGLLLTLNYTADVSHSYSSIIHIIQDISYGWYLHYLHSVGASLLMMVMYLHIGRSLYVVGYVYNVNLWLSGFCIMVLLMLIAFLGYILVWGMLSYWGCTVITNLLTVVPCLIECICGGFYVCNPTLKRMSVVHIILGILMITVFIIHLYYLHGQSSTCPLGYGSNIVMSSLKRIIMLKDNYGYQVCLLLIAVQVNCGMLVVSH
jgi:ubiquinol-cytochrome c reductase cytochrome b subunit